MNTSTPSTIRPANAWFLAAVMFTMAALLGLAGCGGGGGDATPAATATTASVATIGAAGGVVTESSGAGVTVPAGALSTDTPIGVAQSSAGAPAMPAGLQAFGPMVAFTPHGTSFAVPATITVPFDPSSVPAGTMPTLYKTNAAMTAWEPVIGATVSGSTMTGQVVGFSFAIVAPTPPATVALVNVDWHYVLTSTGSDPATDETVVWPPHASIDQPVENYFPDYLNPCMPYFSNCGKADDRLAVFPRRFVEIWFGDAFATRSGKTYWVEAVAPVGIVTNPHSRIGLTTVMTLTRVLRKTEGAASQQAVISNLLMEAIDGNPDFPAGAECPWRTGAGDPGRLCDNTVQGSVEFKLVAWRTLPNGGYVTLRYVEGTARLRGWRDHWVFRADTSAVSDAFLFDSSSFSTGGNDPQDQGQSAFAELAHAATVNIPLDLVDVGGEFTVQATVTAKAYNRRQRESFVGVTLRDPAKTTGVEFVEQGVEVVTEAVARPTPMPPTVQTPQPAPACAGGSDPAAGVLQFEAASLDGFEQAGGKAQVLVTRSGGGKGSVSAVFTSSDGSARTGVDYVPVTTVVRFNDGEQGARMVTIPILDNTTVDGDRTVQLALTQPMGCAALGAPPTSTLVIHDDDARPGPVSFRIGGSVSGLTGSGLVLREVNSGNTVAPVGDGPFTFPEPRLSGLGYDVRVDAQPTNPIQHCSVAHGSGVVGTADITDVAVTCSTPAPNGSLDPSFGSGGKVATGVAFAPAVPGAPIAMALQADGRVLLLGGLKLLRYNADGTPDTSFGTAGLVTVPFTGSVFDTAQGLAVQADGKIVIVGFTRVNNQDDFALARFNADGTLDTTFGSAGKVSTDFYGNSDQARRVRIQPDGKIIVAGLATTGSGATADTDFAVVRYNADGSLDTAFGSGGKVNTNIAGKFDSAQGLALQGDGKIVLAGRVGVDGGSDPDFGVARYGANGSLDASFGTGGIVRTDFGRGNWEEATDVSVQADGLILVTGRVRIGAVFNLALARFNGDGTADAGFGAAGLATTAVTSQSDVAKALVIQADGKVVVVGQSANLSANPDMAIARYQANGSLDTAFGATGILSVDFFGAIDGAEAVAVQPDGEIIVGGFARNAGTTGFALIRVIP